jgi:hypothetical protein
MIVHCWPGVWFFVVSQRVLFFVVGHWVRHWLFIMQLILICSLFSIGSHFLVVGHWVWFFIVGQKVFVLGHGVWFSQLATGFWFFIVVVGWSLFLIDEPDPALLATGSDSPLSDTETPFSRCFDAEFFLLCCWQLNQQHFLVVEHRIFSSSSLLVTESTVFPRCWPLNPQRFLVVGHWIHSSSSLLDPESTVVPRYWPLNLQCFLVVGHWIYSSPSLLDTETTAVPRCWPLNIQ